MRYEIDAYEDATHRAQVIALWETVFGYDTAHNAPSLSLDRKLAMADGLLLVALEGSAVVGTVMAGYDGHRGWIYSMAVHPAHRGQGIGTRLLANAEERLVQLGCVKINLQVLPGNGHAQEFYERNGYAVEERISMGKRLVT